MSVSAVTTQLTPAQVAEYHREGFLSIPQLAPPDDVARLRAILDDLFAQHRTLPPEVAYELGSQRDGSGPVSIPQIIAPSRLRPELLESQYFRNARTIARQLLGDDCNFQGDHAIYKPPQNRKETPWHQDQAYWAPGTTTFSANFWMPLLDCPVEAGCMQFIPRSHLGDLLPHHRVDHDPKMHTLMTDHVDVRRAVPCPLAAGGATVQGLKTLHYTGPNLTDNPRPAYILTFGYEWLPQAGA
jgi:hypothetical protein